jgi:uncharacterized protein (UPF0335 family)
MTDQSHNVTEAELRAFIERAEQLAADAESDLMKEVVSRGYDRKAFKEVLRLRKMKPDDRAAFEAMVDMYRAAGNV